MPVNERLRDAINRAGTDAATVAAKLEVSPKTVERWVTQNREPYRKHRTRLAGLVGETEGYLWPDALTEDQRSQVSDSEVIQVFASRSQVPTDLWKRLLTGVTERVEVLVYAGLFLAEEHDVASALCQKGANGTDVRLLFGDPNGARIRQRSEEEGLPAEAMGSRVANALAFIRSHETDGCFDVRLHDTTLYSSIFRFDDEMLVNAHIHGLVGAKAPVLHLRQLGGGDLFSSYVDAFERVWKNATPLFEVADSAA